MEQFKGPWIISNSQSRIIFKKHYESFSTSCYLSTEQRLQAFVIVSSSDYLGFSRPSLRDCSVVSGSHSFMRASLSHRSERQPFQWTNLYMTGVHPLSCAFPIKFFQSFLVFFTKAFQCCLGSPDSEVISPHSMTSSTLPRIPPPPWCKTINFIFIPLSIKWEWVGIQHSLCTRQCPKHKAIYHLLLQENLSHYIPVL